MTPDLKTYRLDICRFSQASCYHVAQVVGSIIFVCFCVIVVMCSIVARNCSPGLDK